MLMVFTITHSNVAGIEKPRRELYPPQPYDGKYRVALSLPLLLMEVSVDSPREEIRIMFNCGISRRPYDHSFHFTVDTGEGSTTLQIDESSADYREMLDKFKHFCPAYCTGDFLPGNLAKFSVIPNRLDVDIPRITLELEKLSLS
ncbi:hypothetical protein FOL47_002327 [Perkinsus chesapeaki]|uniref:Uncharacterized protein n=1 Tax=Perkinsus chesapeaki TaxID=330153 RepID=A0A7J6KQX6_PERCH|nr:hypothetical protein FOL47_002327 [Perkinsus chesapeaki]